MQSIRSLAATEVQDKVVKAKFIHKVKEYFCYLCQADDYLLVLTDKCDNPDVMTYIPQMHYINLYYTAIHTILYCSNHMIEPYSLCFVAYASEQYPFLYLISVLHRVC